jgi:hypothetical protein
MRAYRIALACASVALVLEPGAAAKAQTPADYLVQMVCDDGSGGHTNGDPLSCPTTARKLRIGESLPYHKYDGPPSSTSQISDSFPVGDIFGQTRVIHSFYFTYYDHFPVFDGASAFTSDVSYNAAGQVGATGYDISMADGTYVSFMGTYDGGRGWQPFWTNSGCGQADNWVIAPRAATIPFAQGSSITSIQNSFPQCPTVNSFGSTLTVWNNYANVAYEHAPVGLDTIKSWHFGGPSLNEGSFEVFYFTREYGKTRWEAWRNSSDPQYANPRADAVARCPLHVNGGYVTFGSTTYTLQDCHDWSLIVPLTTDWDPAANWHVDPLFNSGNLLKNTHFQCTSGGVAATCTPYGGAGVCQTLAPWNALGSVTLGWNEALMGSTESANCSMTAITTAAPAGQSVYQDVTNLPSAYTNYTFGINIWQSLLSNVSASQPAVVTVFEVGPSGVIAQHNVPVNVTRRRQFVTGSFARNPATTWLRFQVYFNAPNLYYEMSDAWVAPAV